MTLLDHRVPETFRERCTPVLETERLVLRAPRLGDAKAVAQLANDRRIAENPARIPHPYTLVDAEKFIASVNQAEGEVCFLITREKIVLGAVGLAAAERDAPELGYWLGVPFWGHGYATEAAAASLTFAFDELNCPEVVSFTALPNERSIAVMRRLGMTHDPADDFDHPKLPAGHPMRRHVLYRLRRP